MREPYGPYDRDEHYSHFCDRVGSTVYAPRRRCPYCDGGSDDE